MKATEWRKNLVLREVADEERIDLEKYIKFGRVIEGLPESIWGRRGKEWKRDVKIYVFDFDGLVVIRDMRYIHGMLHYPKKKAELYPWKDYFPPDWYADEFTILWISDIEEFEKKFFFIRNLEIKQMG